VRLVWWTVRGGLRELQTHFGVVSIVSVIDY
jgi:hypothetical protein